MIRGSRSRHKRRPVHTTLADLEIAFAPFRRPSPRSPYDVPESLKVVECRLAMGSKRLEFSPSAKTELAKFLPGTPSQIGDGLTWLADDLGGAFFEEFHHARRHTKRQLEGALLALVRRQCTCLLPVLPAAFVCAVESAERRRASGALLPHDVPRSQIFAETDIDELMDAWRSPGSVEQLSRLADALFRAVRKRRTSNWEELALVNTRGDPLHQAAVKSARRMWIERLDQRAAADTSLVALCVSLLMLIDPSYRAASNDKSVDAVRAAVTAAFRDLLARKKCA